MATSSVEVPVRDVVVGVDGSEGGYHAMAWAAGEALRLTARLVVVHAYAQPVGVGSVTARGPDPRGEAEALVARSRARFERTAPSRELATTPGAVEFVAVRGDACAVLVHHARRGAVVVVGRRASAPSTASPWARSRPPSRRWRPARWSSCHGPPAPRTRAV